MTGSEKPTKSTRASVKSTQYLYVNDRLQGMINTIGRHLEGQGIRLARKTRGRDEVGFNRTAIAQFAVADWVKGIESGEARMSLETAQRYALEYVNALKVTPHTRQQISRMSDDERAAWQAQLDLIHEHLKPYRASIAVLSNDASNKEPNDVCVITMAIVKVAERFKQSPPLLS